METYHGKYGWFFSLCDRWVFSQQRILYVNSIIHIHVDSIILDVLKIFLLMVFYILL